MGPYPSVRKCLHDLYALDSGHSGKLSPDIFRSGAVLCWIQKIQQQIKQRKVYWYQSLTIKSIFNSKENGSIIIH